MEKEYKMSASPAQDELQEELNYLKTTRSDEVAEQIKIARGFGDLSENSEYDEAKERAGQALFPHRRAGGDPAARGHRGRGRRSDHRGHHRLHGHR